MARTKTTFTKAQAAKPAQNKKKTAPAKKAASTTNNKKQGGKKTAAAKKTAQGRKKTPPQAIAGKRAGQKQNNRVPKVAKYAATTDDNYCTKLAMNFGPTVKPPYSKLLLLAMGVGPALCGYIDLADFALPMQKAEIKDLFYELKEWAWELPEFNITKGMLQGQYRKQAENAYKRGAKAINATHESTNIYVEAQGSVEWSVIQEHWARCAQFFRNVWILNPVLSKIQAYELAMELLLKHCGSKAGYNRFFPKYIRDRRDEIGQSNLEILGMRRIADGTKFKKPVKAMIELRVIVGDLGMSDKGTDRQCFDKLKGWYDKIPLKQADTLEIFEWVTVVELDELPDEKARRVAEEAKAAAKAAAKAKKEADKAAAEGTGGAPPAEVPPTEGAPPAEVPPTEGAPPAGVPPPPESTAEATGGAPPAGVPPPPESTAEATGGAPEAEVPVPPQGAPEAEAPPVGASTGATGAEDPPPPEEATTGATGGAPAASHATTGAMTPRNIIDLTVDDLKEFEWKIDSTHIRMAEALGDARLAQHAPPIVNVAKGKAIKYATPNKEWAESKEWVFTNIQSLVNCLTTSYHVKLVKVSAKTRDNNALSCAGKLGFIDPHTCMTKDHLEAHTKMWLNPLLKPTFIPYMAHLETLFGSGTSVDGKKKVAANYKRAKSALVNKRFSESVCKSLTHIIETLVLASTD